MPSAYTAIIQDRDDVTFREFALRCARAFGALIDMRDEPLGTPLPEKFDNSTSDHYREALARAEAKLRELRSMTLTQAEVLANAEYEAAVKSRDESERRRLAIKTRYDAMLAQAEGWEPPTEEHKELRHFMVSQLEESIKWDCGEIPPVARVPAADWLKARIDVEQWGADYYARQIEANKTGDKERQVWIDALRKSL